ncbi:hypothetical protein APX70_03282 [Pseudomonas syringae pv. maculicola]|uniref:Uncharacterized protein n=1 Tax=Pseudomonas syringae pv. maculicola TaxID=59511 RepID=A0A3M2UB05_PSEYM|nr:hypothetical protein APX70_03282 [Pseudomonas syringae pv. maculicola]
MQVQFTAAHAVFEAFLEADQGVFRCFALGAAVAVDKRHVYSWPVRRQLLYEMRKSGQAQLPEGWPCSRACRRC